MFLFSRQQLCKLLPVHQPWPLNSVMEIGAGDGNISEKYRSLGAASVCATEASGVMRRVLRKKGFKCVSVNTLIPCTLDLPVLSASLQSVGC